MTKSFHPASVCLETDLEEVLLRIYRISSKPPVAVLVYLLEICRRVRPAALPCVPLDLPLTKLLDLVQDVLAHHDTLSVWSVQVYLSDLRYLLNRFGARLGSTTLRDHFPHGDAAWLTYMVGRVTRRLERAPFHWGMRKVFTQFIRARRKDVFIFLRARFWIDKASAEEATTDTFLRVERKLRRFNSTPRRLIEFTFGQAWFVMKEYIRKYRRRAGWESSLHAGTEENHYLEDILAAPVSAEFNRRAFATKLRLLRLLFHLDKPPHQIVVYILCCLCDRTPLEILADYSNVPLLVVLDQIETKFQGVSEAPEHLARAGFKRLRSRMQMTLAMLIRGEKRQASYGALLHRRAGDILLGEYFLGADVRNQALKLVQAWYSVKKALVTGSKGWWPPPPEPPPLFPPKPKKVSPPDGPLHTGAACKGHGRKK